MPSKAQMRQLIISITIGLLIIGIDQITKHLARTQLSVGHPIQLCGPCFQLTLHHNSGSFLGLGSTLKPVIRFLIFSIATPAAVFIGVIYAIKTIKSTMNTLLILVIIIAGSVGNQIDRMLFNGYATDFLYLEFGKIRTGVFNVADMAIMFGAGMLVFYSYRKPNQSINTARFAGSDPTASGGRAGYVDR